MANAIRITTTTRFMPRRMFRRFWLIRDGTALIAARIASCRSLIFAKANSSMSSLRMRSFLFLGQKRPERLSIRASDHRRVIGCMIWRIVRLPAWAIFERMIGCADDAHEFTVVQRVQFATRAVVDKHISGSTVLVRVHRLPALRAAIATRFPRHRVQWRIRWRLITALSSGVAQSGHGRLE